jgi:hypothetical protein
MMGSTTAKNLEFPDPLQTLPKPVIARIGPALRKNHLGNKLSIRLSTSIVSGVITWGMISI